MKKSISLIFLVIVISFTTMAQVDYSFGYIKKKRDFKNIPTIGIKGGMTLYTMHFSDNNYNDLPGEYIATPGFGVFIEYPINIKNIQGFTIGAELMSIGRGYKKDFMYRETIREIDKLETNYIDLRIPFGYCFFSDQMFNPYVFVAPDFAFCYGGTYSKEFPDGQHENMSVDIAKSDAVISPFDLSLIMGAGIRFNFKFEVFTMVLKLDGSYNFGILNNNRTNGNPVDVYAYAFDDNDKRQNRGFEFMLSIGLPLKFNFLHDACYGW